MNLSEDEEQRIYFDDDLVASLIDSVYEKGENHVWREDRCRTRDVWTIPYNIGHCTYDSLNHILQWKNEYRDFSRVENTMATMRYDEKGRLIEAIAEEGLFKQPLKDWMKKSSAREQSMTTMAISCCLNGMKRDKANHPIKDVMNMNMMRTATGFRGSAIWMANSNQMKKEIEYWR